MFSDQIQPPSPIKESTEKAIAAVVIELMFEKMSIHELFIIYE